MTKYVTSAAPAMTRWTVKRGTLITLPASSGTSFQAFDIVLVNSAQAQLRASAQYIKKDLIHIRVVFRAAVTIDYSRDSDQVMRGVNEVLVAVGQLGKAPDDFGHPLWKEHGW